ncbi:uncharacterized protein C10orf143 homolog isoform X2 [Mustela lutreola]|uniref:uncharacterized protein C10orf143 homolog isoform X2 n=1 Tax=Mustela lutreola TaxID=9666 RepID=UPI00279770F8|nr:uncharacterized protein C10orf143 homolog isoform X2 [Mustela lutreola]
MTSWVGQAGSPRALHLFSGQIAAQRLLTASGRGCGPRSPRSVRSPGPASRGESPGFDTGRSAGSGPSPSGRPASPPARRARDRPRGARAGLARVPGPGRALAGGRAVRSGPPAAEAPPRSAAREGSKLRATGRRGRPFPAAGRGRRLGSRGRRLTGGSGGAAPPARLPEDASAAAGGEAPPAPPHSPAAGRESPARGARRRPGTAPRRCRPEVRPDPRDYSSQRPAPSPQRIGSLRRPSATRRGKTAATALSDQSRERGGGRSPADRPPVDQAWRDANGLGSSGWARGDRPALETWGPGTEAPFCSEDAGLRGAGPAGSRLARIAHWLPRDTWVGEAWTQRRGPAAAGAGEARGPGRGAAWTRWCWAGGDGGGRRSFRFRGTRSSCLSVLSS